MPSPTVGKSTVSGAPPGPNNLCVPTTVDDGPSTITRSWLPDDAVIAIPCGPTWNTVLEPMPPEVSVMPTPFVAFWGDDASWKVPFWVLMFVT